MLHSQVSNDVRAILQTVRVQNLYISRAPTVHVLRHLCQLCLWEPVRPTLRRVQLISMSSALGFVAGVAVPWFVYAASDGDTAQMAVEVLGMLFLQASAHILIAFRLRRFVGPTVFTSLAWVLSTAVAVTIRTVAAVDMGPQRPQAVPGSSMRVEPVELFEGWLLVWLVLSAFVGPCICCSRGVSYALREQSLRETALAMATADAVLLETLNAQFDADNLSCMRLPGILLRACVPCLFESSGLRVDAATAGSDAGECDEAALVAGAGSRQRGRAGWGNCPGDDSDADHSAFSADEAELGLEAHDAPLPPPVPRASHARVTPGAAALNMPPLSQRAAHPGSPLLAANSAPTPGSAGPLLAELPGFLPPAAAKRVDRSIEEQEEEDEIGTAALMEPAAMRAFGFDSDDAIGNAVASVEAADATSVGSGASGSDPVGDGAAVRSPHDPSGSRPAAVASSQLEATAPGEEEASRASDAASAPVIVRTAPLNPGSALEALFAGLSPSKLPAGLAGAPPAPPAPPAPQSRSPKAPPRGLTGEVGRQTGGRRSLRPRRQADSGAGGSRLSAAGWVAADRSALDLTSLAGDSHADGAGAESGMARPRNSTASDISGNSGHGDVLGSRHRRSTARFSGTPPSVRNRLSSPDDGALDRVSCTSPEDGRSNSGGELVPPSLPAASERDGQGLHPRRRSSRSPIQARAPAASGASADERVRSHSHDRQWANRPGLDLAEEIGASSIMNDVTAASLPDDLRHPNEDDIEADNGLPIFGESGQLAASPIAGVGEEPLDDGALGVDAEPGARCPPEPLGARVVVQAGSGTTYSSEPPTERHDIPDQRGEARPGLADSSPRTKPRGWSERSRFSVSSGAGHPRLASSRLPRKSISSTSSPSDAKPRRSSLMQRLSLTLGAADQSPDAGGVARQGSLVDRRAVSRHRRASISRDSALLRSGSSSFHIAQGGKQQTLSVQGSSFRQGAATPRHITRMPSSSSGQSMRSWHSSAHSMRSHDRTGLSSGTTRMQTRLARIERRTVLAMEKAAGGRAAHVNEVADEDERIPPMPLSLTWCCCGSAVLPLEFVVASLTGEADRQVEAEVAASNLVVEQRRTAVASLAADAASRRGLGTSPLAGASDSSQMSGPLDACSDPTAGLSSLMRAGSPVPGPEATTPGQAERAGTAVMSLRPRYTERASAEARSPTGAVIGLASPVGAHLFTAGVSESSGPSIGAKSQTLVRSPITRYFIGCRRCDPCPCITWCCIRLLEGDMAHPASPAQSCLRRRGPLCPPPFMLSMAAVVVVCTSLLHGDFDAHGAALVRPGAAGLEAAAAAWIVLLGAMLLPVMAVVWDALRRNHARRALDPGTVLMISWLLTTLPGTIGKVLRLALQTAGNNSFGRFLVMQGAVLYCSILTWVVELAAPAMCTSDHDRQPLMVAVDMLLTMFLNLVTTQELRPTSSEFVLTLMVRLAGMVILDTRLWEDTWRALRSGKWWCRFTNERMGWLAVQRADRVVFAEQLALFASATYLAGNVLAIGAGLIRDDGQSAGAVSSATLSDRLFAFGVLLAGVLCVVPVVRSITSAKLARSRLRRAVLSVAGVMVVRERTRQTAARSSMESASRQAADFLSDLTRGSNDSGAGAGTVWEVSRQAGHGPALTTARHRLMRFADGKEDAPAHDAPNTGRTRLDPEPAPSTCSSEPEEPETRLAEVGRVASPKAKPEPAPSTSALPGVTVEAKPLAAGQLARLPGSDSGTGSTKATPRSASDAATLSVSALFAPPGALLRGRTTGSGSQVSNGHPLLEAVAGTSGRAQDEGIADASMQAKGVLQGQGVPLASGLMPGHHPLAVSTPAATPAAPCGTANRPSQDHKEAAVAGMPAPGGRPCIGGANAHAACLRAEEGPPTDRREQTRRRFSGGRSRGGRGTAASVQSGTASDSGGAGRGSFDSRDAQDAALTGRSAPPPTVLRVWPAPASRPEPRPGLHGNSGAEDATAGHVASVDSSLHRSTMRSVASFASPLQPPPRSASGLLSPAGGMARPPTGGSPVLPSGAASPAVSGERADGRRRPLQARPHRRERCGARCACPRQARLAVLCLGDDRSTNRHWMYARAEYLAAVIPYAVLWGAWASLTALLQ